MGRGSSDSRATLQLAAITPVPKHFPDATVYLGGGTKQDFNNGQLHININTGDETCNFYVQGLPWGVVAQVRTAGETAWQETYSLENCPCTSNKNLCLHTALMNEILLVHVPITFEQLRAKLQVTFSNDLKAVSLRTQRGSTRLFSAMRIVDDLFLLRHALRQARALYDASLDVYSGEVDYGTEIPMLSQVSARLFSNSDLAKKLVSLYNVSNLNVIKFLVNRQPDYPYLKRESVYNNSSGEPSEELRLYLNGTCITRLASIQPAFVCYLCTASGNAPAKCPHLELASLVRALRYKT